MRSEVRYLLVLVAILLSACGSTPAQVSPTAESFTATVPPSPTATLTLTSTPTVQPTLTPTFAPTLPATPVQPVTGLAQGTDGYPWWNDAVFYEIFVRSFYDSDNDGIGDFNGLTAKLDYLNDGDPNTTTDLGITGLWLMPIQPSPSYHGYDLTDYYAVNPEYGTMDEFKNFLAEAHKRGIRVTIDWVLNHTSSQHPWFQAAQDPASPYRDWYVWTAARPTTPNWNPGGGQEYYYARFGASFPDLNYNNPKVVAEMKKVARFWLQEVGVDGFRLDAAKHLFEEGTETENTPQTHAWFKQFRPYYKALNPKAMLVGEIADNSENVSSYLNGDELDLAFDFDLAKKALTDVQAQSGADFQDSLSHEVSLFRPGQFAVFLTNHDQDRAMSVLGDDLDQARNAAFLLLTSPGVPFLYYGEEIGMLGKKPDEDIRRPMQWAGSENAGFTTSSPWRSPASDYVTKNVESQKNDPNSLLSFYRALVHIRNDHAALRTGDFYPVDSGNRAVYASLRVSKEETLLILINLSPQTVSDYALNLESSPLANEAEYVLAPLLDTGSFQPIKVTAQGGLDDYRPLPALPPFGRFILQLQQKTN